MKIRDYNLDEISASLESIARPNGIKIPTDATMHQVSEFIKTNYSYLDPEEIRAAFNYWVTSENYIKQPHYLNSKFIADVLRFYKSQRRINNGLDTADKRMEFTAEEVDRITNEHLQDMKHYVQIALTTRDATFLNVKSLEYCDMDLLKSGAYSVETYTEKEINAIGAILETYLKDMAKKTTTRMFDGFLLTSTDMTFEAARAATHFMQLEKTEL